MMGYTCIALYSGFSALLSALYIYFCPLMTDASCVLMRAVSVEGFERHISNLLDAVTVTQRSKLNAELLLEQLNS